jgi:hypothetical protein
VVLYLNGVEWLRQNVPASVAINQHTLATAQVGLLTCNTQLVSVTNLRQGTNWLAAALCQASVPEGDSVFGVIVDLFYDDTTQIPPEPSPILQLTPVSGGLIQLSWSGAGYALESSPILGDPNSAPFGPWSEVPNMSNPTVLPLDSVHRFFRLKRQP